MDDSQCTAVAHVHVHVYIEQERFTVIGNDNRQIDKHVIHSDGGLDEKEVVSR